MPRERTFVATCDGSEQKYVERFNEKYIPVDPESGRTEHRAIKDIPGSWHGEITYTLQGGCFGFNRGSNLFWAPGHGTGFRSVDQNAKRPVR